MKNVNALPPEEFIEELTRAITPKCRKDMPTLRLGVIRSVSGGVAQVVIDNDINATPVARFCAASVGQRALLLKQGTQIYLIGVQ